MMYIASFVELYNRLQQSPVFAILSSSSSSLPNDQLEEIKPTLIHIYRK